ncbi:MAG: putative sulfate/molybdate transporter [Deltaproteobacteria bacterium]|nr:putative sulfate/molybdate transporter [Deltaproteobacteria bacterium]
MTKKYRFNRLEFAGSLGDLGTLLPLAIGMILINGLSPCGLLLTVGLYYIASGIYFGVTVPVQPMKVIGAYAIATGIEATQILASGLLVGLFFLLIGVTGAITFIGRYVPKSVVRGVQLSTGVLLMAEGVKFMIGTSKFQILKQAAEPYLGLQNLGPVPIGIIIGVIGGVATFLLLENRRFPAGLLVVLGGIVVGLVLGTHEGLDKLRIGINLPWILPFGLPSGTDFALALFILALPQIPMTLGNAVIAYVDLSGEYFDESSKRISYRSACISMAIANFLSFLVGGMPLCHGAGGLAAHYRFGARTAGSNLMIGLIFVALAILLGAHALSVLYLLPMSILGVLLLFAGGQLSLTLIDMRERKELFVSLMILGITIASNLAVGFIIGIIVAYAFKSDKLNV